jgi:integrase
MPTETKRRGVLRWRAAVYQEGKIVASKWFGPGEKERRKAIIWEEQEKARLQEENQRTTPSVSLTMGDWATAYLNDAQRRTSKGNFQIKVVVFRRLAAHLGGDLPLTDITPAQALAFLQKRFDQQSGYSANRDRNNLSRAWEWGRKFLDGFPNLANPFALVDRFKEERQPRYVPPEEDFDRVLDLAQGQDRVMLLTFINLAAHRSEVFRLKWSDIDFRENVVRLFTGKDKSTMERADYIPMSTQLRRELLKWWEERTIHTEYVFTMLEDACAAGRSPGDPFTSRCHFMRRISQRAGVEPFGFHAIRHLSAIILYKAGEPLAKIQKILRHRNATTTNRYLENLGFQLEEIRQSVEVLARQPAQVIPLHRKKTEAL